MTMSLSALTSIDGTVHGSDELRGYLQNKFCSKAILKQPESSINECYIDSWERYTAAYRKEEAFELLRKCYPQLNFPIENGINKTQDYIDAVLKGKPLRLGVGTNPVFNRPESIRFELYESVVGKIPLLIVPDDEDFIQLVQCFLHKNNPTHVPRSMGALLVNGINNWDRIHELRAKWLQNNLVETWNNEFAKSVLPNPGLYKDKLIILSTKPYSNVAADHLGITEKAWVDYSLSIRLEHECTHLYTLTCYGCASNNLHDELIADYIGISKTIGRYDKEWMFAFMGLEEYPNYRRGARLENYLGNAGLTDSDFWQIVSLIRSGIENIASFDKTLGLIHSYRDHLCRIDTLCTTDLVDIASSNGSDLLVRRYEALLSATRSGSSSVLVKP